jgi:hypothetical protein
VGQIKWQGASPCDQTEKKTILFLLEEFNDHLGRYVTIQ